MNSELILLIILIVIAVNYLLDLFSGLLNYRSFNDKIPSNVRDIYNKEEYEKSQKYKKENFRFNLFISSYSFIILVTVLYSGYFGVLDSTIRNYTLENEISPSVLFFFSIYLINDIILLPFQFYRVFVIEQKYGFNTMSLKTFILDKLKGYLLTLIVGLIVMVPLLILILLFPQSFWIYSWILLSFFMIFLNMFYTSLIVPLFNKLTPIDDGDLKDSLNSYAEKVGFSLSNIFVINGSKRSKKANAFFTGFGKNKKIVLYDTLIKNHTIDELVAVLAHEVGHYKLRHVISNLVISIATTGFMLFLMSKFLFNSEVSYALGGNVSFRHLEILAFFILYTPISRFINILVFIKSRKNEYEADNFAISTFKKSPLVSALKKLSRDNLTNLTPHPLFEFINYSHPSLSKRLRSIELNS
tara:strand:- start:2734 stop:3975 length:1242 start_codon:yes stop_codon:yes gene_type:complete